MKQLFIAGIIFLHAAIAVAQDVVTITPEQYIATYKDIAISEMKRMGVRPLLH